MKRLSDSQRIDQAILEHATRMYATRVRIGKPAQVRTNAHVRALLSGIPDLPPGFRGKLATVPVDGGDVEIPKHEFDDLIAAITRFEKPLDKLNRGRLERFRSELASCRRRAARADFGSSPEMADLLRRVMDEIDAEELAQRNRTVGEPLTDVAYQFKLALKGSDPPIWRRVLVPDVTLLEFSDIILTAMGWEFQHLWAFTIDKAHYALDEADELAEAWRISDLIPPDSRQKPRWEYVYDFGDYWRHEIRLEKILPRTDETVLPACLAGGQACPPEDVGGLWGYYEFLDRGGRYEYEDEYDDDDDDSSSGFDPDAFDLEAVNARLRPIPERKRRR